MTYNFDEVIERRGTDSVKWDGVKSVWGRDDLLPMWVADMNFPTVPTIQQAIIERAQHPAFGYFSATDEYYDSIIRWHQTRNGVTGLTKECIATKTAFWAVLSLH